MSVSPLEEDRSNSRGDDSGERLEQEKEGGGVWDRMMEPFDQDEEEERDKEEEDQEDKPQEASQVKMVRTGYHPTSREIAEHMVNHLPYREWCKHCIKGKAKGLPHRKHNKLDRMEEEIPVVSFDYMFMHDDQKEEEEKGMPILVAKDRKKKVVRARVVPKKGQHWYGIKIASGIVDSLGYKRVILRSRAGDT